MAYQPTDSVKRSGKITFQTGSVFDPNASNITRTYSAINVYNSDETAEGVPFDTFAQLIYDLYERISLAKFSSEKPVTYVREQQYVDSE